MASSKFWKVHGLENDFPLFDLSLSGAIRTWNGTGIDPWVAVLLCDRRRGIGGDGVLIVDRTQVPPRMIMFNPDGSRAEMCGNGLRCAAKHVAEAEGTHPARIAIATDAGVKECRLTWESGIVTSVEVDMGPPIFERARIPVAGSGGNRGIAITAHGRRFVATAVSMGNPHAVIVVDVPPLPLAEEYGPAIEVDPLFPRKTNVEFVRPLGGHRFETAVWERGAGITRACGSGACATAAALCLEGHAALDATLAIALLGGDLMVTVERDYRNVRMRGPAVVAYEGVIDWGHVVSRHKP